MEQSYADAWHFIAALTGGNPENETIDVRMIHDQRKDIPAHTFRGSLPQLWSSIVSYQSAGYGAFCTVNALDGNGQKLSNVQSIRAHFVDLDGIDAEQQHQRAIAAYPTFSVASSAGKYHDYWKVSAYVGNDRYSTLQRKLRQVYSGDKSVTDATRVMRIPGTLHLKGDPQLVRFIAGSGQTYSVETLETWLASVNVIDAGGGRQELGEPSLAAPSLDWLNYAMSLVDPNDMDRDEWVAFMAAFKQAGWSLTDEATLRGMFEQWCARYDENNLGENEKQWVSLRNTQLGWKSIVNRIPSLKAQIILQERGKPQPNPNLQPGETTPPMPAPPELDCKGEILSDMEQRVWFDGYFYVTNLGKMLSPNNRFLNTSQFNAEKGGKLFVVTGTGKTTNEPWAAATRSTLWTVPKVDHIRFVPSRPYGEIMVDALDRHGINTYKPAKVRQIMGDPSPFLWHIGALLPDPGDRKIILDYLAHNVQYPGHKIPWAPLIQSAEGAGKGVLKTVMQHCMGEMYCYFPNAKELADSGAKFNGWMRNRLFILCDEIKVDDRLDMIETLKPMISEIKIEIQSKGENQDIEDNFANWLFFSNWKTAVPISQNSRRFAIMYSPLQSLQDMLERQMTEHYFNRLYTWLQGDGAAIVANYLMSYPIERGAIPMRAPETSSTAEARKLSRTPIERTIAEAVDDGVPGFRGGWISTIAVAKAIKAANIRNASAQTIETVLAGMGYIARGRAARPFFQDDPQLRTGLFSLSASLDITQFGRLQGWE